MEHFEDVALEKTADVVLTPEALEVKNAILHAIQNNLKDEAFICRLYRCSCRIR